MRILIVIVVLVLVAGAAASWFDGPGRSRTSSAADAEAVFSPRGGIPRAVASEIARAKTSVRIAAHVLSSEALVAALAEAHRRGVKVEAVLDGKAGAASANALYDAGAAVYLDRQHETLAGALLVIDEATVIVSAVDLADAAENTDAGALLIARSPTAAAKCAENWRVHLAHAEPLESLPAPTRSDSSGSPLKTTHRQ